MGEVSEIPADAVVLAVDGGGSKTDGVAMDLAGNVIARLRTRGSAILPETIGESVSVVDSLVTELTVAADNRPVLQTNVYLSGLDVPAEIAAFTAATAEMRWATGVTGNPVVIDNDMFALLRSGSGSPNAVAVVCGTGINCVGVREDGVHTRFVAWGMVSGDWGGGWFLGEQALWHAARAMDGRGPRTALAERIPQHLGLPDLETVIEEFHFGRLPSSRLSTFPPLIFAASEAGDEVANVILDRQAEEIVTMAVTAMQRLELVQQSVPVVLGGGVLAAGNRRLLGGIEAGLAARAPRATVELVRARPILGAGLLALEAVGAGQGAIETARRALENTD